MLIRADAVEEGGGAGVGSEMDSSAAKSSPAGPREVDMETVAGMGRFLRVAVVQEAEVEVEVELEVEDKRSTSYPASKKRPSGGMKLNSPGDSFHRLSRTQGWKVGSCSILPTFLRPEGKLRVRTRSGTPDSLDVNRIEPAALAQRGRPEGARMTVSVSTMST